MADARSRPTRRGMSRERKLWRRRSFRRDSDARCRRALEPCSRRRARTSRGSRAGACASSSSSGRRLRRRARARRPAANVALRGTARRQDARGALSQPSRHELGRAPPAASCTARSTSASAATAAVPGRRRLAGGREAYLRSRSSSRSSGTGRELAREVLEQRVEARAWPGLLLRDRGARDRALERRRSDSPTPRAGARGSTCCRRARRRGSQAPRLRGATQRARAVVFISPRPRRRG